MLCHDDDEIFSSMFCFLFGESENYQKCVVSVDKQHLFKYVADIDHII